MISKNSNTRYFSHCLLILSCLAFCLSACIKISGEVTGDITCEKCESGEISITVSDCNLTTVVEKTLDGCGKYSILIPSTHIGNQILVTVHCDEDNDADYSIGDGFGQGEWFELQQTNEVNIDINQEFTATIEGEVSCDIYTDGLIHMYVFDRPHNNNNLSLPSCIGGPVVPVNLNENTSYKVLLTNTSLGSEVWLFGVWNKDGKGNCHGINACDNRGGPTPIILDNEEMTGIDLDVCHSQIQPCHDETPQDEYAIDTLPGCNDCPTVLDEDILAELVSKIEDGDYGAIGSLIIIHNDSLALEEYFGEWNRHVLHRSYGATKSFTSALIGIALEEGYISGLDEQLLSFFPEYDDIENLDERKESITLEHVLNMTAGFEWDESVPGLDDEGYPNFENIAVRLEFSDDVVKFVLDTPMSDEPGTTFTENSGCPLLLGPIITKTTGQTADKFAEEYLFSKIGITNWKWTASINDARIDTSYGLSLHPVNMAMFGYLYLKNGLLNGEQIVPENWVNESTRRHVGNYGYHWYKFLDSLADVYPELKGTYSTTGLRGQYIIVMPNINMVIVSTAFHASFPGQTVYNMLFDYILPALKDK